MFRFIRSIIRRNKIKRFKKRFKSIGANVDLSLDGIYAHAENISIGNYVYIGPEPYIFAPGGLTIGDNTIIGPRVNIHTSNHRYEDAEALPYDGVTILKPVHICENVWIGANVLIVPGVTINEGAVVAMGSVVTKDVPKCAIVGGNPAVIKKYRNMERYERLKAEGKFYMKIKYTTTPKTNQKGIEKRME